MRKIFLVCGWIILLNVLSCTYQTYKVPTPTEYYIRDVDRNFVKQHLITNITRLRPWYGDQLDQRHAEYLLDDIVSECVILIEYYLEENCE